MEIPLIPFNKGVRKERSLIPEQAQDKRLDLISWGLACSETAG